MSVRERQMEANSKYIHHIWFTSNATGKWEDYYDQVLSDNPVLSQRKLEDVMSSAVKKRLGKVIIDSFSYGIKNISTVLCKS